LAGNVLFLGLVSLLTDLASEMIYPLLPLFLAGLVPLGMAPVYVGIMEGVAETTASIVKLLSGRFSDVSGRRRPLVLAGYALSSLGRPLMALATAGWHVIALRFLDRVGKGIRTSPRDALITDSVPSSVLGRAFSFHRMMDHTGAVLGPLCALALLAALGVGAGAFATAGGRPDAAQMSALRWIFGLALVPGVLAVVCVLIGVRDRPTTGPAANAVSDPSNAERVDGRGAADRHDGAPRGQVRAGLSRRFYSYVGIVTLFSLGNSSDLFLVFYGMLRFGLGVGGLIGLWIVLHLSKVVFSLPGGALSDRLDRRLIVIVGWVVYATVYAGFALMTQPWHLWSLLVLYGAYYGLTEGGERAIVAEVVRPDQRGTAYGVFHAAVGLAALPASLVFGVLWVVIGPQTAFALGAGLAGLAAILLGAWRLATPAWDSR